MSVVDYMIIWSVMIFKVEYKCLSIYASVWYICLCLYRYRVYVGKRYPLIFIIKLMTCGFYWVWQDAKDNIMLKMIYCQSIYLKVRDVVYDAQIKIDFLR